VTTKERSKAARIPTTFSRVLRYRKVVSMESRVLSESESKTHRFQSASDEVPHGFVDEPIQVSSTKAFLLMNSVFVFRIAEYGGWRIDERAVAYDVVKDLNLTILFIELFYMLGSKMHH